MQIPSNPKLHFDMFGDLRDNYINGEIFSRIGGSASELIIPQFSPFYVEDLVLKLPDNTPLKVGVDYRIDRLDPYLTARTSREVASMIRLLNKTVDELFLYYQAVGTGTPIDETIDGMVDFLLTDNRTVELKDIKGVPSYFVPEVHKKSLRYEYSNFTDTVSLIVRGKEILEQYQSVGAKAAQYRQAYLEQHAAAMNVQLLTMLENHKTAVNPHNLTATTFNLGNVVNVPTATKRQALQGLPNLRLTPDGLNEIIKHYHSKANGLMGANILPIFHYGRDGFLPPSIDGAYLGSGYEFPCGAACLEPNGDLTILRNRYNGRTRGLYFETVDNFNGGNRKTRFTSVDYNMDRFTSDNAKVDAVVNGSNNKILMVFDSTDISKTYLVETGGTFDKRLHTVIKPDVSAITGFDPLNGSIHEIGSYYLYIQQEDGLSLGDDSLTSMSFYGCLKSSVSNGVIVFSPLNLDSTDLHGYTAKSKSYSFGKKVVGEGSTNAISEFVFKFPNPVNRIKTCKAVGVQSAKKPRAGNVGVLHFHYGFTPTYVEKGLEKDSCSIKLQVILELDIDNLTLKPTSSNPPKEELVFDYKDPHNQSYYYGKVQRNSKYNANSMIDKLGATSSVVDQFRVISFGKDNVGQEAIIYNFSPSLTTYDVLTKPWYVGNHVYLSDKLSYSTNSAFDVYSGCGYTAVSDKFDIFYGLDDENFKEVPFVKLYDNGDTSFKARPGVTSLNPEVTTLKARPLSNNIIRYLDKPNLPIVNISADESILNQLGLTIGELSFSCASTAKGVNYPPTDIVPIQLGLTIPVLSKFSVGGGGISIYKEEQIDMEMWMIDDLLYNATGLKKGSIYNFTFDVFTFNGMKINEVTKIPTVIVVNYSLNGSIGTVQSAIMLVNIKLATDGITIGGIEMVGKTNPIVVTTDCQEYISAEQITTSLIPMCLSAYLKKVGNNYVLSFKANGSGYYLTNNGVGTVIASGEFDLTAGMFKASSAKFNSKESQTVFGVIPKVGVKETQIPYQSQAGGAALYLGKGDDTYLMSSTYVDKQFTVFFAGDEQVILAGGRYVIKAGCIDLRDIDLAPENKVFFVYAKLTNGLANYQVTLTELAQTPHCGLIAKVTTGGSGIVDIERFHRFMIDGVELKR